MVTTSRASAATAQTRDSTAKREHGAIAPTAFGTVQRVVGAADEAPGRAAAETAEGGDAEAQRDAVGTGTRTWNPQPARTRPQLVGQVATGLLSDAGPKQSE